MGHLTQPLRIRAHTLLCLQGFRGEGYSPAFVANLTAIHGALQRDPAQLVEVVESPDEVCAACPHLAASGCSLRGEGFESRMREQDTDVLRRVGLVPGAVLPWGEILELIRHQIMPQDLPGICGPCRWLPLGYCADGLAQLIRIPSK